tara:strand:+ start:35995 stop:36450 length:456 start_codon:yes stop_codon:yes gene_type:complete
LIFLLIIYQYNSYKENHFSLLVYERVILFSVAHKLKKMSYKIYHNPRCSKSRQTLEILRENGIEPQIIEYLKETPTEAELTEVLHQLNVPAIEIIRKGESDFKENFKGKDLTNTEWIQAMVKYPKLIERPIVIKGNQAILGRPPQKVLELI